MSLPAGQHVYSVPQRFGLTSIFALTTLMAILFGSLRRVDAPPAVYFCLSMTTLAICCVQMLYGNMPRKASLLTGAIVLPACMYLAQFLWEPRPSFSNHMYLMRRLMGDFRYSLFVNLGSVGMGLFIGYLSGACLAGIFLIQDLVEASLAHRQRPSPVGPRWDD